MSILRMKFKRPRCVGSQIFSHSTDSIVELSEDAVDMPILVDRMKRGLTPQTRVMNYSSMLGNDTETMLSNPPKKLLDPTDVPVKELTKIVPVDETKDEPIKTE